MSEGGGELPTELSEAAFLLHTGWTPEALERAPEKIVQQMLILMNAQGMAQAQQASEAKARARR